MAEPTTGEFVISQGDSLPVMRIVVPANSDGQLIDLTGCTVTFLGRVAGTQTTPPPISRAIQSFAQETEDDASVIAVYVALTTTDTKAVYVGSDDVYAEMEGELEVIDADGKVLTVPTLGYLKWWIRDDIGDGVA